ncbi:myrosinase 1-like [Epargyreus clarus]|uniref:myrosinase 1-like n=1 Tax=Epargyreus clarus TaxID=520877 RepID=UPI003C2C5475
MLLKTVVFCFLLKSTWGTEDRKFPPGFKFGAATASYQVEGGWNADDKTESIWDAFTHTYPDAIANRSNGDVACDSYRLWKRDVEIAAELGLDFYRFSMSWPRLLPSGFPDKISEAGKKYYNNLIDGLLEKGIEPVVTLYHWDLPVRLQDLGGWTNPLITDWFADYARTAFALFGDRVKTWITMNEPIVVCELPYSTGMFPPPTRDPGVANLICNKNILIAHAKAYKIYDEEFRAMYQGEVGITNQLLWIEAETEEHEELSEMARELCTGMYSHAIFHKDGGWPPVLEKYIAMKSKKEGWPRSRLPAFTREEKKLLKGSFDFYGMNYYTSRAARKARPGEKLTDWPLGDAPEIDAKLTKRPHWTPAGSAWFFDNPEGIRNQLVWLKKRYGDIKILITENGYSSKDRRLDDMNRVKYYQDHLEQVLLAIKEDGVNVVGYTAWTLIDNFEWTDGYSVNFGLYDVDFNDPARTRTARASARYYAGVIKRHALDSNQLDSDNKILSDEL